MDAYQILAITVPAAVCICILVGLCIKVQELSKINDLEKIRNIHEIIMYYLRKEEKNPTTEANSKAEEKKRGEIITKIEAHIKTIKGIIDDPQKTIKAKLDEIETEVGKIK